jgi:hypothetical protein
MYSWFGVNLSQVVFGLFNVDPFGVSFAVDRVCAARYELHAASDRNGDDGSPSFSDSAVHSAMSTSHPVAV